MIEKQLLLNVLQKHGQEHLVKFWEELNEFQRDNLYQEIQRIDVAEINENFKRVKEDINQSVQELDAVMQPVPEHLKGSFEKSTPEQLRAYEEIGLRAIADDQVAVLLMAGGQGTRLGVTYPKGMYSVHLPSDKSLFQIQAERMIRIKELATKKFGGEANKSIVWYIMTSEQTQESTRDFFAEHAYFGLDKANVVFFQQYMLPCLTKEGKIILDQKFKISRASDGNGGLYKALLKRRILDDMESRGIKYVHVFGIDNILVKTADPVFIGFCLDKQSDCAAKVVKKLNPEEKVGVICKVRDQFQVVEYSEISHATRNLRDSNGDLVYNAGSICNHFLTTSFLSNLCRVYEHQLKHHIAEKKIPYVDDIGVRRTPSANNGIKLEKFVFDVFPYSSNFTIWEVSRDDEFSALKNNDAAKSDTPTTCRLDLYSQCTRWLKNAGATFAEELNDLNEKNMACEISPLVSYAGEDLECFNGKVLRKPLYIELDRKTNTLKLNSPAM